MGFWDKIRGELIDIVEFLDDSRDTLVYRFERYGNEIKYGAQLVVREGQCAIFVNEGQLADVFGPGTYTLETQNLPILSTLRGGSTASSRRSRPRSISSPPSSSPTSSGARRTPS